MIIIIAFGIIYFLEVLSGRRTEPMTEGYLRELSAIACKVWRK
ncbi:MULTISPECIES: hypothetical protein [unclassified Tolypothrix]|nr:MULTISPECIES: hypothetical protein [unclassified Tolypothrix]EKF03240.1 hypothetical protein FDUTEX481_02697 [Tolypothrix sp. PCC 7601]